MEGLKQRVIGALVLISLAVIFIPMLFDEPHQERVSKVLPIPEKPALPSITIEEPKPLGLEARTNDPVPGIHQEPLDVPAEAPEAEVVAAVKPEQQSAALAPKAVQTTPAAVQETSEPAMVKVVENKGLTREPALDESGLANAWTVQIGTFKSRDNANRLRDRVREEGFKGYTRDIGTADGELVRVFAGPVLTNDEAQRLKAQIEKALGMKTLVVRYSP